MITRPLPLLALAVIAAAAAAAAAALGCSSAESASRTNASGAGTAQAAAMDSARLAALNARADRARIQGDSSALWLIEISDFQCPFCKMWHDSTYPAIRREFIARGFVRMAYINFPITSHANAMPAAEAAMCAGAQDKFWPMHDAIFATQARWTPLPDPSRTFDSLAAAAKVALPEWRDCIRSQATRRLIEADKNRGRQAGATSTPYFFIGSEAIEGAAPIDTFRMVINRARAKAAAAGRRP